MRALDEDGFGRIVWLPVFLALVVVSLVLGFLCRLTDTLRLWRP